MPNVCSFLQSICRWMVAAGVILIVLAFTAFGFSGGRRNVLTAYAETASGEAGDGISAAEKSWAEYSAAQGLEENMQVTEAKIQFRFTDPQSLREGQFLAGNTLVNNARMRKEAWEERKEAIEQAKKETSQMKEAGAQGEGAGSTGSAAQQSAAGRGSAGIAAGIRCSEEDYELLKRIVEAEAGICDTQGRILVANVIMNRVKSDEFPNTIQEVVYQKSQFSPVVDGRLYTCEVTPQTVEAVNRALAGEDYSQGALYFMNRKRSREHNISWFDKNLTYLFQHDRHEFFR